MATHEPRQYVRRNAGLRRLTQHAARRALNEALSMLLLWLVKCSISSALAGSEPQRRVVLTGYPTFGYCLPCDFETDSRVSSLAGIG